MKKSVNDLYISEISRFYHHHFKFDKIMYGHCHPRWEINYILNGTMEMTYDDSVIVLSKGDLFIGEPNAFHKYTVQNNDDLEFIDIEFISQNIELLYSPRVYKLNTYTNFLFEMILNELKKYEKDSKSTVNDGNAYPYIAKNLLEAFMILILNENCNIHTLASKQAQIYNKAFNFMRRNCARNLSVKEISEHCNVCPTLLKKAFTEYTGGGVQRCFMKLKIEKAKQLLVQQNTVAEVSETLSFSSQAYFAYVFKKFEHISPTEYQKKHRF